jgi:hypothetical protein
MRARQMHVHGPAPLRYRVSDRPGLLVNELERGGRWMQRPTRRYESHFRLSRPIVIIRCSDVLRRRQRQNKVNGISSCWSGAPTSSPFPVRDCRTAPCLPLPGPPAAPVSPRPAARRAGERVGLAATVPAEPGRRPPPPHWAQVTALPVLLPTERPPRACPPSWACATPLQVGAPFPQGSDRQRRGIPHWHAASICAARDEVRNEAPRAVRLSAAQLLRAGCGTV